MPLLSFWGSNPEAVGQLSVEQIVSSAGDGVLKDGSACSLELREYLGQIPTAKIATYIEHCLETSFAKSGLVLQDLINELGRRLEYRVENGRYQGAVNSVGYDGLWSSPERHTLITEVKTTDAFRLSLGTLAGYRTKLLASGQIDESSSILIVVGRQDTGELEAQIRGSRHAWDVRLISAEALIKLVLLKEESEAYETGLKIRSLFMPVEYTRLDRMVDVMFTTVRDVEEPTTEIAPETENYIPEAGTNPERSESKDNWEFTDRELLQAKRDTVITALGQREGASLVRKSRALYWNAAHSIRAACAMSKRYTGRNQAPYWYAFHPQWDEFLEKVERAYFVLGCMDLDCAFAIPHAELKTLLPSLHTTKRENGTHYWHIHLIGEGDDLTMVVPKREGNLDLSPFRVSLNRLVRSSERT
ncbi:hypothetical protein SAMN02745911_3286 [Aureimonas altamirensis DSM 21988]|uniref:PD-(D/E)XK nuclease superfamily protein n=1 Tax=Aureimonas altamirensis DSM 21988 TaxID=1121026 RepID=A0ABY1IPG7_9HYPH|nr:hypothetical protein [Aureimonas altamirensis]SHJ77536.1 hypothetical protein SAMN02745911_3286 [Aureimonas altamirensis DSM 21988]